MFIASVHLCVGSVLTLTHAYWICGIDVNVHFVYAVMWVLQRLFQYLYRMVTFRYGSVACNCINFSPISLEIMNSTFNNLIMALEKRNAILDKLVIRFSIRFIFRWLAVVIQNGRKMQLIKTLTTCLSY